MTLDDVMALLRVGQDDYRASEGSAARVLDHHLQCADILASWRPWDVELQIAGLVHDIGESLSDVDGAAHAAVGARFVSSVLGSRVAGLVSLHVTAERYFATVQPAYSTRLSVVGRHRLLSQGGLLTETECAAFEASSLYADVLLLNRAEQRARWADGKSRSLASWLPALREQAARSRSSTVA
jgi:predicted HD phosphohydrolase